MIKRVAIALWLVSTTLAAYEHGPDKGTLVIVGGNLQDPAIVKRFIDLAGGPEAPIVIIPSAGEADEDYHQYWSGLKQWRENGARHLTVLHTRDRKVADSEAFVKPIREARAVFFGGGRQWRLADSYLDTLTHKELAALLNRGGVIGGSSAGASILASFMVRGDTRSNDKMIGDHIVGLGFLKNAAIDQHLLRPIFNVVFALPREMQPAAVYLVNGVLSLGTENVFIATVFINELSDALKSGVIDRAQFDLLAVAVNTGTNVPSVATPNGQAAFLFLLTSTLAPLIHLSYYRMTVMALPYTITMTVSGFLAVVFLL